MQRTEPAYDPAQSAPTLMKQALDGQTEEEAKAENNTPAEIGLLRQPFERPQNYRPISYSQTEGEKQTPALRLSQTSTESNQEWHG